MPLGPWNGPAVSAEARLEAQRRLEAAAIAVQDHAKRLISTAGTAPGKGGGARRYGASRSAPGSPPHKQTGRLRASVARDLSTPGTARVGTNLKYGLYLELGTSRMAARPWLRRALAERRAAIARIFGG